jgi:hypothetical protein
MINNRLKLTMLIFASTFRGFVYAGCGFVFKNFRDVKRIKTRAFQLELLNFIQFFVVLK